MTYCRNLERREEARSASTYSSPNWLNVRMLFEAVTNDYRNVYLIMQWNSLIGLMLLGHKYLSLVCTGAASKSCAWLFFFGFYTL